MSLERMYGGNGRAGQVGEDIFFKSIEVSSIASHYTVVRSVGVPDESSPSFVDGDVMVLNGNSIQPCDVKNTAVAGGVLTNAADGTLLDGNGQPIGAQPSESLHVLADRWRRALPQARILDPIVVIVSTSRKREDTKVDFSAATWNGFQIYSVGQALTEIIRRMGRPAPVLLQNAAFAHEMVAKKLRENAAR